MFGARGPHEHRQDHPGCRRADRHHHERNPEKHNAFDDEMDVRLFEILGRAARPSPTVRAVDLAGRGQVVVVGPRRRRHRHQQDRADPPRADDAGATRASSSSGTSRRRSSSPCRAGRSAARSSGRCCATSASPPRAPGSCSPRSAHGVIPDTGGVARLYQMCGHGVVERHGADRPAPRRRGGARPRHRVPRGAAPTSSTPRRCEMAEKIAASPAVTVKLARRVISHLGRARRCARRWTTS